MAYEFVGKKAVLGRSASDLLKYGDKGTANIGKVVMSAGENPVLGREVAIDLAKPHVMLICGKRGGGKSYTLSVIAEEFAKLSLEVKMRTSLLMVDTVGIFWTMKLPNTEQKDMLKQWGLKPEGTDGVRVLVPKGKLDFYQEKGLPIDGAFSLKVSELDALEWLAMFKLSWKDAEGVLLTRIIEKTKEQLGTYYGIDDIIRMIEKDEEAESLTKQALVNRMKVAQGWGVLEKEGSKISDLAKPATITIIDVSSYRQAVGMEGIKEIIVTLLGKKLFEQRMLARKEEEIRLTKGMRATSDLPIVWMLIDEAHMFMPKNRGSLAQEVLKQWVAVGRQPGLSLILATQRPAQLHEDAISQCDLFISHRMTAQDDIQAVGKLRPTYLKQNFDKYFSEMPREKGYALILDDNTEKIWMVKIRPKLSWHGGKTGKAFTK